MVCNENIDYVLERDILIHFLLGLRPEIYDVLIEKDNLTTLEAYFCEALKLEIKQEIIDEQGLEANESFEYNIKTEAPEMKPDTKHFLEQSMDVEDYDFMNDEEDVYLDDDEEDFEEEIDVKPPKPKRARKTPSKPKNNSDSDYSASEHEADDDFDPADYEEGPKKLDKDQECNFCGKKYATQKALKLHVSKKHTAEGMEGKKKIKCGFCELEFAERRLLTCVSSVERNISDFSIGKLFEKLIFQNVSCFLR